MIALEPRQPETNGRQCGLCAGEMRVYPRTVLRMLFEAYAQPIYYCPVCDLPPQR